MNPQMPRILRTIGFDADYVRAEGAYLFDRDGRRYLDFLAGFGVFALGRCHPVIEQALRDAIGLVAPEPRADGVPAALRTARGGARRTDAQRRLPLLLHQQRRRVGRDRDQVRALRDRVAAGCSSPITRSTALPPGRWRSNGGREFRDRFGDLLPGCESVPFGDLDAFERELRAGDVAAFVVEPIQGKGVFVAPDGYLARGRRSVSPVTARCSPSTRCRPGSGAPARSSRSSSGRSSPIWSPWPRRCPAATCRSAR